jgi:hypothetical protein
MQLFQLIAFSVVSRQNSSMLVSALAPKKINSFQARQAQILRPIFCSLAKRKELANASNSFSFLTQSSQDVSPQEFMRSSF